MTDDEIKQLIGSNAKVIEALSNALSLDRKERRKERRKEQAQLYQYLGRVAAAQSFFYEVQADYYHQLAALQERQSRIEDTLTRILERVSSPPQDLNV